MTPADTDTLIREFIGGNPAAIARLVERARATQEPILLVAAALAGVTAPDLLARASDRAVSTRDRQVVAIAAAHLDGDSDRVAVLARDHLVDHPGNLLVAWIAAACSATARPQPEQLTRPLHHPKEM